VTGSGPPPTTTPAQARILEEVLAWGQTRPTAPPDLLDSLATTLGQAAVSATDDPPPPTALQLASLLRDDAGGSQPWQHDRATLRGILLSRSFARDVETGHTQDLPSLIAAVAQEVAGERPGDPGSASSWWNAASVAAQSDLREELVAVLADVRTLWPTLRTPHVEVQVRPSLRAQVAAGPIVVTGRPDLVLDSPLRDDRARSLVVVTRTGMPRPREDRRKVRATALLTALATGRLPFRWVVLHLTDGRAEVEDLDPGTLTEVAAWLGARIAAHLAAPTGDRPTGAGGARAGSSDR